MKKKNYNFFSITTNTHFSNAKQKQPSIRAAFTHTNYDRKSLYRLSVLFKAPGLDDRSTTAYTEYVQAVAFNICVNTK